MSAPIDAVLSRLSAKPTGTDRWRAVCPVCGERNQSTLSIGLSDSGAVLLRCFKSECAVDLIVGALSLEMGDLFPPKQHPGHGGAPQRRRMLSAQQALDLLVSESLIVFVVAHDVHRDRQVSDEDWLRLRDACARIQALGSEVLA